MRSYEEYREILSLWEKGIPKKRIALMTGIPRRTIVDCIKRYGSLEGLAKYQEEKPPSILISKLQNAQLTDYPELFQAYAYLLGVYLGDGCISLMRKTYRLRVALDTAYPNVIKEIIQGIELLLPENKVGIVKVPGNCINITCYSNTLIDLFPQHGIGEKHTRRIKLEAWQQRIVDTFPLQFWKGLYHTDGSRFSNVVNRKDYPRYEFWNTSEDVIRLFCNACDRLEIHWTTRIRLPKKANHQIAFDVYVSKRKDVEFLDRMVGPKS